MPEELAPPAVSPNDFFRELDTQLLVHELKSPLALIEAATRTLLEQTARLGPLTERQEKTLQRILRGVARGRGVVDQLLEVGRAESSQFTLASFAPTEAVLQVLLESAESTDSELAGRLDGESAVNEKLAALAQRGIRLSIAPDVEQLRVFQDQVKFKVVVGNLIQNALHYRRTRVDVVLHHEHDDMLITITDDGPGVAPEHHAAVFERYKQVPANDGLERQGHGLGLAGALVLARRMGGDISLDSVPGSGATFRLLIPHGRTSTQANPSMARGDTEHV